MKRNPEENNEKETNATAKADIIIPTRGIKKSKKRLRKKLGNEKTEQMVFQLLSNALIQTANCRLVERIIILTKVKEELSELLDDDELKRKVTIQLDRGGKLNHSLRKLWKEIVKGQIATTERIVILMPDVPAVDENLIKSFIEKTPRKAMGICPLKNNGTGMIILSKKEHSRFKPKFGRKSLEKFIKESKRKKMELKLFSLKREIIDIDDEKSLENWLNEKESLNENEEKMKGEFRKILEK